MTSVVAVCVVLTIFSSQVSAKTYGLGSLVRSSKPKLERDPHLETPKSGSGPLGTTGVEYGPTNTQQEETDLFQKAKPPSNSFGEQGEVSLCTCNSC